VSPLGYHASSLARDRAAEEELYRSWTENGRDLICQTGPTGRYLYASPNHLQILGYSSEELVGRSFFKDVHPDDLISVNRHYVLGAKAHQPAQLQFRFRHKNGEWRWIETNGHPIFGQGGPWRATLVMRDVTRLRQAEEQLRHAQEVHDRLLACTGEAVLLLDAEANITGTNACLCQACGYEEDELTGHSWLALIAPDDQPAAAEALDDILRYHQPGVLCEAMQRDVHGGTRPMLYRLVPMVTEGRIAGVVVTGTDLTELRQSEESREYLLEQLEISQKLESIGRLSAGVAHDFNNVLMGALSTNELLRLQLEERPDVTRLLGLQQRALERASQLTQQLLAFTRHETTLEAGPVDLPARVRGILDFCSTQFDKRITVDNRIVSDLPAVLGDGGQVDQILLNLLLNAGQALVQVADEGHEPRITLDAREEMPDAELAERNGLPLHEPLLHLAIHDNGPGIPEELLPQIFDTFFTTRERSQNHGLGLSTTYLLVRNHGGAIEVDSQYGIETTFHVYLPVCMLEMLPRENDVQPDHPREEAPMLLTEFESLRARAKQVS
jgi:two-component system cell cycle sensor histidine kinase/response regulator CckA